MIGAVIACVAFAFALRREFGRVTRIVLGLTAALALAAAVLRTSDVLAFLATGAALVSTGLIVYELTFRKRRA